MFSVPFLCFAVIVFLGKVENPYEGMRQTQDYEFTQKINNQRSSTQSPTPSFQVFGSLRRFSRKTEISEMSLT